MPATFVKKDIVADYIAKYPAMPSLTLAKMLLKREKNLFSTINAARKSICRLRGSNGKESRKYIPTSEVLPGPGKLNPFSDIPEAMTHFDDWSAYRLEGPMRIAIMSDLHIPFHDRPAVLTALNHFAAFKPTYIILNGDIADFFSVSFWEKDPRKRNFAAEINAVRSFLKTLRREFPRAKIIYKEGNHEERYARFLAVKAPEVLGVEDFEFRKILRLDEHKIELVGDKRPITVGKLHIIHGHEFRWGITSPVNPARGFYQRGKECAIGGHLHQTSGHTEKSMADTIVSCWSMGCLCDMHPDYAPINKWNHGYATVIVDKTGAFEVENFKLIKGRPFRD